MKTIPKGWGHELWIVNKQQYCGKLLFMKKGKQMSWHYHKIKDETFYLQSGKIHLIFSMGDDLATAKNLIMTPGMSFHIPVGMRHRLIGLEDSEMFEFSTEHFDDDSYRIEKGD